MKKIYLQPVVNNMGVQNIAAVMVHSLRELAPGKMGGHGEAPARKLYI